MDVTMRPPDEQPNTTRLVLRVIAVVQLVILIAALGWGSYDAVVNDDTRAVTKRAEAARQEEQDMQQEETTRRAAVLDDALSPVCSGVGVPAAAERGPIGTPRRAWFHQYEFVYWTKIEEQIGDLLAI